MHRGKLYIPPSPRSRHANKPKFSQQIKQTYSFENSKKQESSDQIFRSLDKYDIGHQNKENQNSNIVGNAKHQITPKQQQNQNMSYQRESKDHQRLHQNAFICCKHQNRNAISVTQGEVKKYYCFQCSLYEARRGIKLTQVSIFPQKIVNFQSTSNSSSMFFPQNSSSYKQSLKAYIKTSSKVEATLSAHCESIKQQINNQQSSLKNLMHAEIRAIDEQIRQLHSKIELKFKCLEEAINSENKKWEAYCDELQKYKNILKVNKLDVLKNYEECVFIFQAKQVGKILRLYSKQIEDSESLLAKFSLEQIKRNYQQRFLQISQQSGDRGKYFTFSKKTFQSPASNSKFQGVPFTFSNHMPKRQRQWDQSNYLNSNQKIQHFL